MANATKPDLVVSASDNCDESVGVGSVHIVSVSSDAPENSAGDCNTINDMVIAADCKSVQLRSERIRGGNKGFTPSPRGD